jgi:hypothetical protein
MSLLKLINAVLWGFLQLLGLATIQFICVFFIIYRWAFGKLVSSCCPGFGHLLSPIGSIYAQFKLLNPHIVVLMTLGGAESSSSIRALLIQRLLRNRKESPLQPLYPQLRQAPVQFGGYFFWKNVLSFDVDQHIRVVANPDSIGQSEFCRFLDTMSKAPFPPDRSPWEVLIAENVMLAETGEVPCTVIVLKFHHCLADGQAIFSAFIGSCADEWVDNRFATHRPSLWESVCQFFLVPKSILRDTIRSFLIPASDTRNQRWTVVEAQTTTIQEPADLYFSDSDISFSVIKRIAEAQNTRCSAVVVAGISGGIRRYLQKSGQEPPESFTGQTTFPGSGNRKEGLTNDL